MNDLNYAFKLVDKKDLCVGKLVVSFFFEDDDAAYGYYRAKVTKIEKDRVHVKTIFFTLFWLC